VTRQPYNTNVPSPCYSNSNSVFFRRRNTTTKWEFEDSNDSIPFRCRNATTQAREFEEADDDDLIPCRHEDNCDEDPIPFQSQNKITKVWDKTRNKAPALSAHVPKALILSFRYDCDKPIATSTHVDRTKTTTAHNALSAHVPKALIPSFRCDYDKPVPTSTHVDRTKSITAHNETMTSAISLNETPTRAILQTHGTNLRMDQTKTTALNKTGAILSTRGNKTVTTPKETASSSVVTPNPAIIVDPCSSTKTDLNQQ